MSETDNNPVKEPKEKLKKKKPGRVFKETKRIFHDLFKLGVAKAKKNVSWQKDIIDLKDVEHVHFFHTYDSAGVRQNQCVPTAGHFHLVEWEEQEDGPAKIKSVSGPMKWGYEKDKRTGRRKRVAMPYGKYDEHDQTLQDQHQHEIEYIESCEVQVRQVNTEAVKTISKVEGQVSKPHWVR